MPLKKRHQLFNDGVCKVCTLTNVAKPGDKPNRELQVRETLRFQSRTVGFGRYWIASQAEVKISLVLRCPRRDSVSTQDLVQIVGLPGVYQIMQVQHPEDTEVRCMDLSLQRIEADYDDMEVNA